VVVAVLDEKKRPPLLLFGVPSPLDQWASGCFQRLTRPPHSRSLPFVPCLFAFLFCFVATCCCRFWRLRGMCGNLLHAPPNGRQRVPPMGLTPATTSLFTLLIGQTKVHQYLFLKATEDVETQRRGIVLVFWGFGPNGHATEFPTPDKREHLGKFFFSLKQGTIALWACCVPWLDQMDGNVHFYTHRLANPSSFFSFEHPLCPVCFVWNAAFN
jgi:hypothetical protein